MTAYTDARASLVSAITAAKVFLADRDTAANLNAAFDDLVTIRNRMDEWIRSEICLQAIDAANDAGITNGLSVARIQDLRHDAERLRALGVELRELVILIAGKAEQP